MLFRISACAFALCVCLSACDLHFGALPPPTVTLTTAPPKPILTVAYVNGGDLYLWREDQPTPRKIASIGVIEPFLAPDGKHVAFTRGQQGDKNMLWVVGSDGTGETELVTPDDLRAIRSGHPQIYQVEWLSDNATVFFNTYQRVSNGSIQSDDLYRVALAGSPQLLLPAGAGGDFALSPDGQHVAVGRAGVYDTQKGQVALFDLAGTQVGGAVTFTALRAPDQPPFYLPLAWSADGAFVRVPVPNADNDRVALWRVPVAGEAAIFGYISATLDGLPIWSASRMIYLHQEAQTSALVLTIAAANGEQAQVYASGKLASPRWVGDGTAFAYRQDGALWFRRLDGTPRQVLDAAVERVVFAGAGWIVYVQSGELRAAHLDDGQPMVIDTVPASAAFDAVVAP